VYASLISRMVNLHSLLIQVMQKKAIKWVMYCSCCVAKLQYIMANLRQTVHQQIISLMLDAMFTADATDHRRKDKISSLELLC